MEERDWLEIVRESGLCLKDVPEDEQTPGICMAAVRQDGFALEFVCQQTPEICVAAVRQNGWALEYVHDQTHAICLEAVQQNGNALIAVREQTPEICFAAVQQNGAALEFVKEQTSEICMAAVQQYGRALQFVHEQTPEICLEAFRHIPKPKDDYGLKKLMHTFKTVKDKNTEICIEALKLGGKALIPLMPRKVLEEILERSMKSTDTDETRTRKKQWKNETGSKWS